MARVKLSEYQAKQLLFPALKLKFSGFAADPATTTRQLKSHFGNTNLVLKVDQGIKKRGKLGLVKLNLTPSEIPSLIKAWHKKGWSRFLVEPVIEHAPDAEHYLSLELTRAGWVISYLEKGGIEVEESWDQITHTIPPALASVISTRLIPALESGHLVFLELNPVLIRSGQLIPLDMAAEVDSAGSTLPTLPDRLLSEAEKAVSALDSATPASLKLRLINPHGAVWMLLSGGGASLVLADEVADQGMGQDLANYGEYSGAPGGDDVYAYTKIVLDTLLNSSASKKALVIAGGTANFTDIEQTFRGVIRALAEKQKSLERAKLKIFVRRGGPNEARGLQLMQTFLTQSGLLGSVHGHTTPLTQVVSEVKAYL